MKIKIMAVGGLAKSWQKEAEKEFLGKCQHYIPVVLQELMLKKNETHIVPEIQKENEGKKILAQLQAGDYVVLCDEKGKKMDSMKFSQWTQQKMSHVPGNLVIIIGGAYGFSAEVKKACREELSFSDMTMNHQLFRLVLLEQVYRALTIWRNEPYHHA